MPARRVDGAAWAATPRGVYASGDRGASWERLRNFPAARANDVSAAPGDAGGARVLVCAPGLPEAGVLLSEDGGQSWSPSSDGLVGHRVMHVAFADDGARAFAGTHDAGVCASDDGGRTWAPTGEGPRAVLAMAVYDVYIELRRSD